MAVWRRHGHDAARIQVNDRKSACRQAHASCVVLADAVRSAVNDAVAHPRRDPLLGVTSVERYTPAIRTQCPGIIRLGIPPMARAALPVTAAGA